MFTKNLILAVSLSAILFSNSANAVIGPIKITLMRMILQHRLHLRFTLKMILKIQRQAMFMISYLKILLCHLLLLVEIDFLKKYQLEVMDLQLVLII